MPYAWGAELAGVLPDSRFVTLEGSGHNFLVAGGEKATAAVLDFLREADLKA